MFRNNNLKHWVIAVIAFILVFTTGCSTTDTPVATTQTNADSVQEEATSSGQEADAPQQDAQKFTIGVSTNALSNEHGRKLYDTAQQTLESRGHTAVMVNANGDPVRQVSDIENLIQRGVDAIIVQNGDQAALAAVILQASEKGIPIVSVETGDVPGVSVYITPNDFVIGATISTFLSAQIGNGGDVAVIYHNNHPAIRTRGLMIEAVLKEYSALNNVAYHQSVYPGTTEDAYAWMESILPANPNLKAVFCSQDLEAIGVARAIQAAGRTDIITVGVDGEKDALQIIKDNGPIIGTAIQDVETEAELSVDAAIKLASGQELDSRVIFIPFKFVTEENVDEFLNN